MAFFCLFWENPLIHEFGNFYAIKHWIGKNYELIKFKLCTKLIKINTFFTLWFCYIGDHFKFVTCNVRCWGTWARGRRYIWLFNLFWFTYSLKSRCRNLFFKHTVNGIRVFPVRFTYFSGPVRAAQLFDTVAFTVLKRLLTETLLTKALYIKRLVDQDDI